LPATGAQSCRRASSLPASTAINIFERSFDCSRTCLAELSSDNNRF
jgi:hypothetical protein